MTTPAEDARREAEAAIRRETTERRKRFPKAGDWQAEILLRLLDAERANSEGLRKALRRFGDHERSCTYAQPVSEDDEGAPCNCGFGAALSASPSPTLPNTRMAELEGERDTATRALGEALEVRTWTEAERDGMAAAFKRASEKHGHYETLFAVGAWLLRHRAALSKTEGKG